MNRIRDARGGKLNSSVFGEGLNSSVFGERMRGKGQYWNAQEKLFEVYTRRLGFKEHRVGSERHTRGKHLPPAHGTGILVWMILALPTGSFSVSCADN